MGGSIDVDVPAELYTEPAIATAVYRYDGSGELTLLPNIQCEQIEFQIGPTPSTARLKYILEHSIPTDWPTQFEQVWPVTASGPYVVQPDDRIVICAWTPEGDLTYLFDGFAQIPQANVTPEGQAVTFTAVGVESRCWDVPVGGRVQRDGSNLTSTSGDRQIDLPTRFNPSDGRGGIRANCTPTGYDVNGSSEITRYPVFVDEHLEDDTLRLWTIAEACCYILGTANDQEYVRNPAFDDLRAKATARRSSKGDGTIDPADPSTYATEPLTVRDLDVTNRTWPDVLDSLLSQLGLGFYFDLDQDSQGLPRTKVIVERRDVTGLRTKTLRLDRFRRAIDPRRSNVAAISMSRDVNQVVNAWTVETPPRRYEVSVVLAPGFTPAAGDESGTNRNPFLKSRLADATATIKRKYRYYIADECGEGHYDGATFVTGQPIDLAGIFPVNDSGARTYVHRFRPGTRQLISKDSLDRPRTATLHYSQDYAGDSPALWDGTGTWTEIGGGWQLLDDRLGIEVTIEDPEQWFVAKGKPEIKGITWQANPPTGKRFWLLLTTVIEDDLQLETAIPARVASPTRYERRRRIDARDHYKQEIIAANSWFNRTANEVISRDDTDKAKDLARQYRMAHEMAPLAGSVTVPFITAQYQPFDRIKAIEGRKATLRTNVAAEQGEGARYPYVVKVVWQFTGERQSTTIHLSDLRGEPPRA